MIKTIIFDFDGVINDSFSYFYPLIKDGMKCIGKDMTEDQYRGFFNNNVHKSFREFIGNEEKISQFLEFRKNKYFDYYKPKLFPGIASLLKKIKKYNLTIASSGNQEGILKLLKDNGLDDLFDFILSTSEPTKEHIIKEILEKTNALPEETFMISDTTGDILIAKELDLKTIAVTWGFHSLETLKKSNPDHIANNIDELSATLIDENGSTK